MKKNKILLVGTSLLLMTLFVLLNDIVIPLRAGGSKMAICGYHHCIVTCSGENCGCFDFNVGDETIACYCADSQTIKYCPPEQV